MVDTQQLVFKLPREYYNQLKGYAGDMGMTMTVIIRTGTIKELDRLLRIKAMTDRKAGINTNPDNNNRF